MVLQAPLGNAEGEAHVLRVQSFLRRRRRGFPLEVGHQYGQRAQPSFQFQIGVCFDECQFHIVFLYDSGCKVMQNLPSWNAVSSAVRKSQRQSAVSRMPVQGRPVRHRASGITAPFRTESENLILSWGRRFRFISYLYARNTNPSRAGPCVPVLSRYRHNVPQNALKTGIWKISIE